jgi:hypothetical protein
MTHYPWPSREQWAENRRTPYLYGYDHPYRASLDLSLYATAEEVAAAIADLRQIWCLYGRKMKAPPDGRDYQYYRSEINARIKEMREGFVPKGDWSLGTGLKIAPPALHFILERYLAAEWAGIKKWEAEVAARPIDDEAWEAELEWRRRIESKSK